MRSASAVFILVVGLASGVASQAAAQDQAAQERSAQVQAEPAVPAHLSGVPKVERPGVGPRLPEFVASIPLPVEAPAPAPSGNIVIPVTTALIVLAAIVLVLLID